MNYQEAKEKRRGSERISMAYSIDFRKQAITYMDEGHTYAELKETFGIFPSTPVGRREEAIYDYFHR